ncbi:MAG: purine-binding chemotaxis protein CheW [Firmicutes bacterium]|nr:purine-binding chemotaxis protein CheW [Bacillota bacterium]
MADETRQFVSFYLGKEKYGVDIEFVQEIIRMPALTKTPLAPPYVEGLANLRGTILTVVNSRVRFGLERRDFDEASRVIVVDYQGRKLGFVVDRVSDVVTVALKDIEAREAGRDEFVEGVAKTGEEDALVLVVNVARLFPRLEKRTGAVARRAASGDVRERLEGDQGQERQFVSFRVRDEEYAIDIMDVQEILHLPKTISKVPGAPDYCEGVATLRGKLLPLVRLGSLLGMGDGELDERCRVVVVNLVNDLRRITAGFAVDSVSEVLRVSEKQIEPVPALLRTKDSEFISGVCKLGEERLVNILDAGKLFSAASGFESAVFDQDQEAEAQESQDLGNDEDQYVTFLLAGEEYGAPISQVQEIIRVPQIFAVPKAPEFIEGVVNIRGQVIPVVDLRTRFGLEKQSRSEAHRIVVVDLGDTRTGLIVDAVREVLKIPRRDVEQVPEVFLESDDTGFLSGIGKARRGERILILLDLLRLLNKEERSELERFREETDQSSGG